MTGPGSVLILVHNTADTERHTNRQLAGCRQHVSPAAAYKPIVYLCLSRKTDAVDTLVTIPNSHHPQPQSPTDQAFIL